LSSWKALPEGGYIHPLKFAPNNTWFFIYTNNPSGGPSQKAFQIYGFAQTNSIPFPSEDAPSISTPRGPRYIQVPYIAFDYMGRLVSGRDEIIPLVQGNVMFPHDGSKNPIQGNPVFVEQPPGNGLSNTFNVVYVDWLTGRARAIQQEVR
jgi:hypothetical protein